MIYQIHRQRIDDPKATELVAQGDPSEVGVGADGIAEFTQNWIKDVAERSPLPDGYQWMVCTEESDRFVRAPLSREPQ